MSASVYAPLVEAFKNHDPRTKLMLAEIGERIHRMNPEFCLSVLDGLDAAKRTFALYCDAFLSLELSVLVRAHYELPGTAPTDRPAREHFPKRVKALVQNIHR